MRSDEARRAVAHLAQLVEQYAAHRTERERTEAEVDARRAMDAALRRFSDDVAALKARSIELTDATGAAPAEEAKRTNYSVAGALYTASRAASIAAPPARTRTSRSSLVSS